jgi:AraC-like DNA-binding protein
MRFYSYEPLPPLADFIHNFWHCADAPSHSRERILPSGTIELVINLCDDEVRIYDARQPESYRRFPGIVISGTYAGAFVIDPSQHASMMGVHFRPGGAFAFFGGAVGELTSSHVALEALWGRPATELRERLCAAASPQKRFRILENMLNSRLRRLSEHAAVSLALEIFGSAGIGDSVHAVAERVGLSQRRLIQVFTAQVGLTPKLFCRVLRFQQVREYVDQATTLNWGQVALACNYCDQSHLIRDFQKFSGLTPTDYLSLRSNCLLRNHVPVIG